MFLVVLLIILGLTIFLVFVLNLDSRPNENDSTPVVSDSDVVSDQERPTEAEFQAEIDALVEYVTDTNNEGRLTDPER
ncbi:MAG: hypothetical protein ACI9BF_000701 [Candidatus Paceibacteria bacterium]